MSKFDSRLKPAINRLLQVLPHSEKELWRELYLLSEQIAQEENDLLAEDDEDESF